MKIHAEICCLMLLALTFPGCKASNKFEATISRPIWFYTVDAPEVSTSAQVSKLWRSEKRCCEDDDNVAANNRIFYKSCYNAISAHYEDEALVVKCLWLMDAGAEKDQRVELYRFVVENFPGHRNRVDDCVNCMPGDTVARVTLDLARIESYDSKERGIGRIENLLDTRENEISYWVQAEIYESLGRLYLEAGLTSERLDRYKRAYARLDVVKESNEPLQRRFAPLEKLYEAMMAEADPTTVKLEK